MPRMEKVKMKPVVKNIIKVVVLIAIIVGMFAFMTGCSSPTAPGKVGSAAATGYGTVYGKHSHKAQIK